LENVFVADQSGDTLLFTKELAIKIAGISLSKHNLRINKLTLTETIGKLHEDSLGHANFDFLSEALSSSDTTASSDTASWKIKVQNISIFNLAFEYKQQNNDPPQKGGVNFSDLRVNNLNLTVSNLKLEGDSLTAVVKHLNLTEKSGFRLNDLNGKFLKTPKSMELNNAIIIADRTTLHLPRLKFSYPNMGAFSEFVDSVNMSVKIKKSVLDFKTLSYFVPTFISRKGLFFIDMESEGPVANLNAKRVSISTEKQTHIETSFTMRGLPAIDSTLILCNIESLRTTPQEAEQILNNLMPGTSIDFAKNLQKDSPVDITWSFNGYLENFVTFGTINSQAGIVSADLYLKPQNKRTIFDGNVEFRELDAAKLLADSLLGKVTVKIKANGFYDRKKHVEGNIQADLERADFRGYSYGQISFNGKATENSFDGSIDSKDPNFRFNLGGKIDFSSEIPIFDFSLFLARADLYKLKLYDKDSTSLLSLSLKSKITGNNLDNLNGELSILNPIYRSSHKTHKLGTLTLNAVSSKFSRSLFLKSEMLDAELRGRYSYANISLSLPKLLEKYIPSIKEEGAKPLTAINENDKESDPSNQSYILKVKVKKAGSDFLADIVPTLLIGANSTIFSIYNPVLQTVNIRARFPEIGYGSNKMKELSITALTSDSLLEVGFTTNQMNVSGIEMDQVAFTTTTANNQTNFDINWNNQSERKNQGKIAGFVSVFQPKDTSLPAARITFSPTTLTLNDTIWSVGQSTVDLDTNRVSVNNINLFNKHQSINISGKVSGAKSDTIGVALNNLDISGINFLSEQNGYKFNGLMSGIAKVSNIVENPIFTSDIYLRDLKINDKLVGTTQIQSIWNNATEQFDLDVNTERSDTAIFRMKGYYKPKEDNLNLDVNLHSLMFERFSPFLTGVLSKPEGFVSGKININGHLKEPSINGHLKANKVGFTVDFLNTHYWLNAPIEIKEGQVSIKNGQLTDQKGGTAEMEATFTHNFFKDIGYKINVYPKNLLCLKTTQKENELFYGTAYVSGTTSLSGTVNSLQIDVNATTEKNTNMMIPLNTSSEVSSSDFVTIAKPKTDEIIIEENKQEEADQSMQLNINIQLDINNNAEAQIIIDPKVGDIIKATGNGNLKMEINPNQNIFKIFGDYTIESGDYLFTLQNIINKHFKIDKGSTLRWNGDAANANIDVRAVYKLKSALSDLLNDASEQYKRRVPVECQILLTENLLHPTIKFNINVPNIDAETGGKVRNALNTEEKVSKQFLSLLVINSFFPDMAINEMQNQGGQSGQNFGSASVSITASELLSNQLSNWLSQLSKTFDIGFKYRPGDQVSNDEVELAISTQLFDDRVAVNGNVDMGGNRKTSSSAIAGDFDIEYKLTPKMSVKGFTRANDNLIYERSPYTQGVGIFYREEFDNVGELFRKTFGIKKAKKEEKKPPLTDSTNKEGSKPKEIVVDGEKNANTTDGN